MCSEILLARFPWVFIPFALVLTQVSGNLVNTHVCGKSTVDPASSRIYGGQKAKLGAWPWLVYITEEGYPYCAGSILNERYILTATHCFLDHYDDLERWQVHAGKLRTDKEEPGQQTVNVSKIIGHKGFDLDTVKNDIALVRLAEPLNFTHLIKPICLPDVKDIPRPGEVCLLAGWGVTDAIDRADQITLNQVSLPIIADEVCNQTDWLGKFFLSETMTCAGYEDGGKDGCDGDSGAPLICKTDDKWVVKGISSWGYECGGKRVPGVYTDVTKFLLWIHRNMASDSHLG